MNDWVHGAKEGNNIHMMHCFGSDRPGIEGEKGNAGVLLIDS